jgi:hypothetical protein
VSPWTRRFNLAALVFAVGFTIVTVLGGVKALNSPGGFLNGVPFLMFFFLATVTTLGVIGDVRIMRSGQPRGGPRLARHLWRMCFALFIAAGSFFSVPARCSENSSGAIHECADACPAHPLRVWRDVLLAVEGPRSPHVASARPTRFDVTRHSRHVNWCCEPHDAQHTDSTE